MVVVSEHMRCCKSGADRAGWTRPWKLGHTGGQLRQTRKVGDFMNTSRRFGTFTVPHSGVFWRPQGSLHLGTRTTRRHWLGDVRDLTSKRIADAMIFRIINIHLSNLTLLVLHPIVNAKNIP